MKTQTLLLHFLLASILLSCSDNKINKPQPFVDERTELMSIVFRLGGNPEYTNNCIDTYTKDIDSYFAPYKEHELIKWIPILRQKYRIGFDAVMTYAIQTVIKDGKITFDPDLKLQFDYRWSDEVIDEFLVKLNDFYQSTNFNSFFTAHKPLYDEAGKNFSTILDQMDFNWFQQYYGERADDKFILILSMANGGLNFGPSVTHNDGKKDLYAIVGACETNESGYPVYEEDMIELLVHEFNHSFCNPLIDAYFPEIEAKANELFASDEALFKRNGYASGKVMLYEILVRASVIQYYKYMNYSEEIINREFRVQQEEGYTWITELCDKLSEYEMQRDRYPTLRSFMPEIVKLINSLPTTDAR